MTGNETETTRIPMVTISDGEDFGQVTPELLAALAEFHKTCPPISKMGTGFIRQAYSYATLDDINRTINPLLAAVGLFLTHNPTTSRMVTRIYHVGGGYMESISTIHIDQSMKNQAHAWGSALTYTKRYITTCMLNLVTGELDDGAGVHDDDGAAVAMPAAPKKKKPKAKQKPQPKALPPEDNKPWLNKGKDLDEIKKALAEGRMGMAEVYDEFKVSKATRSELQEIVARAENNRSFIDQAGRHDGLDHF